MIIFQDIKIDIKKENSFKDAIPKADDLPDNPMPSTSNNDAEKIEITENPLPTTSNHIEEVKNFEPKKLNIASELIVISDDEEDFFSCSQLFKLDKQIKKEHEECSNNEQMEDFLAIKREVEYLDEVDTGDQVFINQVPINVESGFQDTDDLFRILVF